MHYIHIEEVHRIRPQATLDAMPNSSFVLQANTRKFWEGESSKSDITEGFFRRTLQLVAKE